MRHIQSKHKYFNLSRETFAHFLYTCVYNIYIEMRWWVHRVHCWISLNLGFISSYLACFTEKSARHHSSPNIFPRKKQQKRRAKKQQFSIYNTFSVVLFPDMYAYVHLPLRLSSNTKILRKTSNIKCALALNHRWYCIYHLLFSVHR